MLDGEAIPVLELTQEASTQLLELAGYSPSQLEDAPPALPLSVRASVRVQVAVTPSVMVHNVLGVLPGSDQEALDKVLILGAHIDHVGTLPDGTMYPGANNDASGVAVLLEIARLWQDAAYQPRRTVLFAVWNATESGLLGSRHYVDDPVHPMAKTVAVIQLDSVGQGRGFYNDAFGNEPQEALLMAELDRAARQVESRLTLNAHERGSDHEPFHEKGVPSVMLTWERPEHMHTPYDTADKIDVNKMAATGRMTALALMSLANE